MEETHEITEAEFDRIHGKGSPHTSQGDYDDELKSRTYQAATKSRDEVREKIKDTLLEAMPKQVIPRYLRRAVWSQDPARIHKAIIKATAHGWTKAEMVRQVRSIAENRLQNKEYEVQESI